MSHYKLIDGVAVITLNRPPVNALGLPQRRYLADAFYAAARDATVQAIVITGAGRGFSGGADIAEFGQRAGLEEPAPLELFARIEASTKPVVAALHGMALGGGLELALACHARVAYAYTQVGLPEVHLGLLPGAGGTQRLPRLVGLELALNLIVQGRVQAAHTLRDSGLFDRMVEEGDVLPEAIALARELAQTGTLRRSGSLSVHMPNAQAFMAVARATVKAQFKGMPAPLACVDCVEAAATESFKNGLAKEQEAFQRLKASPQGAGLCHMFMAEKAAAHVRGLSAQVQTRRIERSAVIGGGTMGVGITMNFANAGIPVTMVERESAALERGLAQIRQNYEATLKKGRLTQAQFAQRMALVTGSLSYADVGQADVIVEAVFEDYAVKREVFEQLDAAARPGAILATNTSTMDINRIAAYTQRPQDVLGLHFFSPANVMKLLEVVRAEKTSPEVLATAMALARTLGKTGVVSGVCDGFIGNRMLEPYMMQAGLLLDEGALPQQVDRAMENWGMAMGPFRVSDLAGNDLGAKIRQRRLADHPELVFSRSMDAMAEMGRLGQKSGRGWYDYRPGERVPVPSEEVNAAIVAESQRLGLTRRRISDEEIVDRLLLALVNEGAKILEEGIAQQASDLDVVYTAGYGFPRWRGGPMFQAEQRGLHDVLACMQRYAQGPSYQKPEAFWAPTALLTRLAEAGHTFSTNTHTSEPA